jgi:hypothetical protein
VYLFPTLCNAGVNLRTSPGSSVVVIAFLLGVVGWYAAIRSARIVVGILQRA